MQNIYTTTQKQNVIDLVNRGDLTPKQIAEMTGTNKKYVYNIKYNHCPRSEKNKKHGNRYTLETKKAVIELYKAGFSREQISNVTSISDATVRNWIWEYRKGNPGIITVKQEEAINKWNRICELRNAGKTYKQIAHDVGISVSAVGYTCNKYGITAPAKRARRDNGEIPQEILAPLVEYMRKFISAEFAGKVQELAKNMAA